METLCIILVSLFAGWLTGMVMGLSQSDKSAVSRGWLTHGNGVYSVRKQYMGDTLTVTYPPDNRLK